MAADCGSVAARFASGARLFIAAIAIEVATVIIGALLIGVGLLVVRYYEANPDTDLLSIALGVMTFFYSALLGIFPLGLLTRTRGATGANILGAIVSIAAVVIIKYTTDLAWPWFIVIGTLITFAIAFGGRTTASALERFRAAELRADHVG